MRIIDPYYLLTCTIIIIGVPLLVYIKLYSTPSEIFQIVIIGSKIDSILLANQLAKLNGDLNNLINITIIGKYDSQLLSYADSKIQNDKINMASLYSPYIDRKILNFCGTQPLTMQLFQDAALQYKIKRSETLFNKGNSRLIDEQFTTQIYNIEKQHNTVNSIFEYGLSHLTATSLFQKFQRHLENGIQYDSMNKKSMRSILNEIIPAQLEKTSSNNGLVYMSQKIGLDQKYIRDYINPIVFSTYFHNVNSIAMIFKALPLYCKNYPSKLNKNKGRSKNLAMLLDERVLIAKLLLKFQEYKNIHLMSQNILGIQQKNNTIHLTLQNQIQNTTYNHESNLVVLLQDFSEENQKQISYYRTLVDGIITNDDQFEEIYTIHFQIPPIFSITRLCTFDCKGFKSNAYLVMSKIKITEKDLIMFAQHQIINHKKIWLARSQLPPLGLKFEQTSNFYRVTDTELISDNYEMKLIIYKSLALAIYDKINESQQ